MFNLLDFHEGSDLFNYMKLDKITFRVIASVLNLDKIHDFQKRGFVTITNAGGAYWDISLHAEGILPWVPPLIQMGNVLALLMIQGVIRCNLGPSLLPVITNSWDWSNSLFCHSYIQALKAWEFIFADSGEIRSSCC